MADMPLEPQDRLGSPKSQAAKANRQQRLDEFGEGGEPPAGEPVELLCEDHVGTYTLPYLCHWSDGTWRNASTEEPVKTGVVGWRPVSPKG